MRATFLIMLATTAGLIFRSLTLSERAHPDGSGSPTLVRTTGGIDAPHAAHHHPLYSAAPPLTPDATPARLAAKGEGTPDRFLLNSAPTNNTPPDTSNASPSNGPRQPPHLPLEVTGSPPDISEMRGSGFWDSPTVPAVTLPEEDNVTSVAGAEGANSSGDGAASGALEAAGGEVGGPANLTDTLSGGSEIERLESFYWRVGKVCLEGGTGEIFLIRPPNHNRRWGLHKFNYHTTGPDGGTFVRVPWMDLETAPKPVAYEEKKVLWIAGTIGMMEHFSHWAREWAVPYFVGVHFMANLTLDDVILHVVNGKPAEFRKSEYVAQLTRVTNSLWQIPDRHRPEVTTCYKQAYLGWPSDLAPGPQSRRFLSKEEGWRGYHILRQRLWAYAASELNVPYASLATPERRLPKVGLTIRASPSGFGRNITNTAAVMEAIRTQFDGVVEAEVIVWERRPLFKQMQLATTVDILMGIHGNNLGWMQVMRPQSVVVMLQPFGITPALKGVNLAALPEYRSYFWDYMGLRCNHTFMVWTSSNVTESPKSPKSEYKGKVFSHRCRAKSSRTWMCRHLNVDPSVYVNLVNTSLSHLGAFTGVGYEGEYDWEKEQRRQTGGALLH